MRSLLIFIWKHNFFFLFLLLETISVGLIVRNNYYQQASFINSSNYASASITQSYNNITDYFSLKQTNEILADENARLRSSHKSAFTNKYPVSSLVNDTLLRTKYEYLKAKVVGNTTNRRNNFITLDIGFKQGVTKDMGVISSNGVIGIVKDVSENFSSVMSLLNSKTIISSKVKKDGSFGPLTWDGRDYSLATLTDIPAHVRLAKGDTIVTSGYSSIYPENVNVGIVDSFEQKKGDFFYTVRVKLSTDFKKINYVYIVKNLIKQEQDELEMKSQKDD